MNFSIITCTHNPDTEIFNRLIAAVANMELATGCEAEWIVVDNNSSPAVEGRFNFSWVTIPVSLVKESKPGLTAARLNGIGKARHEWLVFFDDDNEPTPDYLIEAGKVIQEYPQVGAWGPGRVEVVFQNPDVDAWVASKADLFQQRNATEVQFACERQWQPFYPYGTGLVLRKDMAVLYAERVRDGRYTMTDRKGKSLSSGGDIQMVWTAIEQGNPAGITPTLRVNHHISKDKSILKYILRQEFGTASAYIKAFNQVFPGNAIKPGKVTNVKVLRMLYAKYRIHFFKMSRSDFKLLIVQKMGEMNAGIIAIGKKPSFLLKIFEKYLG
ncbi:MAG: glycosyltransferase [Chitinophagales bacterium]|nr:glycosyltransferase [Chitinophagales bacterium]